MLAAMDRYMHVISADDLQAMAAMQTPDGMTYRARATKGAGMETIGRPNSYWVDPARADGRVVRERYWSPTVLVRGSIAVVWAPYEFWAVTPVIGCRENFRHVASARQIIALS